jgi:ABC-type branched-subunit amino acid transport system substrate-binding protein
LTRSYTIKNAIWVVISSVTVIIGMGCSAILGVDNECKRNSDCATFGANLECRSHLCVETKSGGDADSDNDSDSDSSTGDETPKTGMDLLGGPCNRIDGMSDPTEEIPENAIIIGSILPITGELSIPGGYFDHVTILANEEINRAGGILGRDIIKVACDSGTSPNQAKEAAEHLRDLGIEAVVGPFSSEIVMSVYSDVLRDAGMMMVSAGANAPVLATVSSEGLIWSTSLPAAREAAATAEVLLHSDWERIAVIHRSDTWGDSMYNAFYEVYCTANGIDCSDDDAFIVRSYDTADLATSISAVITEIAPWQPDVTVAFSYIDDALTFLTIVSMGDIPLRSLLWNSSIASDIVFSYLPQEHHEALCQLQATTQQMPKGTIYGSFLTRYRARWDGENPVPYTTSFYDAFYMLAYAYAAASSDENPNPSGAEIAAAMKRLSEGTTINAGAEDWNVGVMALRSSEEATIDYVGASGDVNFPEGTGSVICPVEAVRFNVGSKSIESVGEIFGNDDTYSSPDYSGLEDTVCGTEIQP